MSRARKTARERLLEHFDRASLSPPAAGYTCYDDAVAGFRKEARRLLSAALKEQREACAEAGGLAFARYRDEPTIVLSENKVRQAILAARKEPSRDRA